MGPPLVDSEEYRKILNDLIDIRSITLCLLIFPLHYQFSSIEVKNIRWYDKNHKTLGFSAHYKAVSELMWNFSAATYEKERSRQEAKQVDLNFVVKFLLHNNLPNGEKSIPFESVDQVIGQVILHSFTLLGLTHTELETKTYMRGLSFVSPVNQPYALLVLELLHFKNLSGNPLEFTDLKNLANVTENPNILLISRVLSILPMNYKEGEAWQSYVDHDLLGFNSILKAVNRSMRNLFEMVLLSILIRNKVKIHHNQFIDISQRLPFFQENSTALGIVVKDFLMSEKQTSAMINEKYECCVSASEDLKKGIQFWNEIVLMVKELGSQNLIESSLLTQFSGADAFLKSKQSSLQ